MRFTIDVPTCCDRWELVEAQQLSANLSRSRVRCAGCGQVRVLTVTSLNDRTRLEVVA